MSPCDVFTVTLRVAVEGDRFSNPPLTAIEVENLVKQALKGAKLVGTAREEKVSFGAHVINTVRND